MSDMLDKIGKLFFEDDDAKAAQAKAQPPVATASSPPPPLRNSPPPPSSTLGMPDEAMMDDLVTKLKASRQGFAQLSDHAQALADVIPDEAMRYKAAIKLTIKSGTSVDALLGDYEACFGFLETKSKEFQAECDRQTKKKVEVHRTSASMTAERITTMKSQIESLQKDIAEAQHSIDNENAAAEIEAQKIETMGSRFLASLSVVRRLLEEQKAKIAEYGKGLSR